MKLKTAFVAACALFVAAAALSYAVGDRAKVMTGDIPLARPLALTIPSEKAGWKGADDPMPQSIVDMLKVTDYVRRGYRDAAGEFVHLYVAYHGNKARGMETYYHNATVCFPSQGWTLESEKTSVETLHDAAKEVPVCRYVFAKEGARQSVLTFFKVDETFLDQSPRNKAMWSFFEKLKPQFDDSPGTFVQVQIIAAVGRGGEYEAADLQSRFLRDFGRSILDAVEPGPSR